MLMLGVTPEASSKEWSAPFCSYSTKSTKSTESDYCEHEVLAEDNETKTQHFSPAYIQQYNISLNYIKYLS